MINNSLSSFIDEKKQGFEYIEKIKTILFHDLNLRHQEILILGAGGFSLTAENAFDNHITYIDIDPQIKKAAIPKFTETIHGQFIPADARYFLQSQKKHYDAIVVDAYSNIHTIPAHLLTYEYMQSIRSRLTLNGTVIFNMIAKPTLSDPYSKRIDNTIRSVFKNCMVIPNHYHNEITNILYVCSNQDNQQEAKFYKDNLSSATTDSFEW